MYTYAVIVSDAHGSVARRRYDITAECLHDAMKAAVDRYSVETGVSYLDVRVRDYGRVTGQPTLN